MIALRRLSALLFVAAALSAPSALAEERQWDQMPQQVRAIPAEYPEALKASGVVGRVALSVTIDTEGNVTASKILKSSHAEFEASAQAAAAQYKFKPAMKAGKPVPSSLVIMVRFDKAA